MALAAFFRRSAGLFYVISMHNPILPQNGDSRFHQEADDLQEGSFYICENVVKLLFGANYLRISLNI